MRQYERQLFDLQWAQHYSDMSQTLHDSLGYALTGLLRGAEACQVLAQEPSTEAHKELQKMLETLQQTAQTALRDVRGVVDALQRPTRESTDNCSLTASLQALSNQLKKMACITVNIHSETDFRSSATPVILACIRESATNALRHGHASILEIELTCKDSERTVVVRDNGCGADQWTPHYGLSGMRRRMQELGGTAQFTSYPGGGFTVILMWKEGTPSIRTEISASLSATISS